MTRGLGLEAVLNGYGMSEAGSVAQTRVSDPPEVLAESIGRLMAGLEGHVVDPETIRADEIARRKHQYLGAEAAYAAAEEALEKGEFKKAIQNYDLAKKSFEASDPIKTIPIRKKIDPSSVR